ncbi:MAG: MFS transporter [Acidiferrobacterales bacterium]
MPYWRLSGFYFFYFATVGALIPYWGLYLKSIHFTAAEIGQLMALLALSRIVAPNVWGWFADVRGNYMGLVQFAAACSVLAFLGVFVSTGFWWLAAVMLAFAIFWDACLPQLEAATLNHLAGRTQAYARIRLWGSIGFIVTVTGLGQLFDRVPIWWLLPGLLTLLLLVSGFTLLIPESDMRKPRAEYSSFLKVFLRAEVAAFLAACFLMQASHGPYYTFYSIYLEDFGYSKSLIGALWALGVVCEIGVFLLMHQIQLRVGLRQILWVSFAVAALRWLLIGHFPEYLGVLVFAQMLHALTFGAYHAAAIALIHQFFTGHHQVRGQAIYSSVSFGLGGAIGSFYSGMTWSSLGPKGTFGIASLLALLALVIALVAIKRET